MGTASPSVINKNQNKSYSNNWKSSNLETQSRLRGSGTSRIYGKSAAEILFNSYTPQKETISTIASIMLNHLNYCMIDDAKEVLNGRREELVEWLSKDEYTPNAFAKKMESYAKHRCHMVPAIAEFMIILFADAGRLKNLRSISETDNDEIAEMALKYLQ